MTDELQHLADLSVAALEVSGGLGLRSRTTVVRAGRTRPDQIDVWGKLLWLQVQNVGHKSGVSCRFYVHGKNAPAMSPESPSNASRPREEFKQKRHF